MLTPNDRRRSAESATARGRRLVSNCLLYAGLIGLALTGVVLGLSGAALIGVASGVAIVADDASSGQSQPNRTYLNMKIADLREIRHALARSPYPEPLPRIVAHAPPATGSAAGSETAMARSGRHQAPPDRHRGIAEARNALAKIAPGAPAPRLSAYTDVDRHAVR